MALTQTGKLSLRILNLNRLQLTTYRHRQSAQAEERRLLQATQNNLDVQQRINAEQSEIIESQKDQLDEQRRLLEILLKKSW